jgi:hypothetical protein
VPQKQKHVGSITYSASYKMAGWTCTCGEGHAPYVAGINERESRKMAREDHDRHKLAAKQGALR